MPDDIPDLDMDIFPELCPPEIDVQGLPQLGQTRVERRVQRDRLERLDRETDAAAAIGQIPGLGREVVLLMTGNYHGFDLLAALLELAGVDADEVWVATLGFNRNQTDRLAEFLDAGKIKKLTFLVSALFTAKNDGEYKYIHESITSRGHTIASTRNHAKLILIKLADGRHLVAHGSLNLRRCNCFEQVAISQDPKLYRFFKRFIIDAMAGIIRA